MNALLLPGGVMNPDRLRMPEPVEFVKHFAESGEPIAATCHGPWTSGRSGSGPWTDYDIMAISTTDPRNAEVT